MRLRLIINNPVLMYSLSTFDLHIFLTDAVKKICKAFQLTQYGKKYVLNDRKGLLYASYYLVQQLHVYDTYLCRVKVFQ